LPVTGDRLNDTDLVNELARGFLLQVALDYGFLRPKPMQDLQQAADSSFGTINIEQYDFVNPGYSMDFNFLHPERDNVQGHPEFATFQAFMKVARAERFSSVTSWGNEFLLDSWRKRVKDMAEGRTLFLTKHGYIGVATNPNIEPGDVVTVLYGGKSPFILRPKGMAPGSDGITPTPIHCLVSDAYVYGLMDGEAIKLQDSWVRDRPDEPALREFFIV
jgi:hypothetical protein